MNTSFQDKKVFLTHEVFTPTTPAIYTFVERNQINEKLVNALATPGKQIIVYGHSGNGKSTLIINKLRQTYSGHITTRCMKGMTVTELMINAFDKLNHFQPTEKTNTNKSGKSASIESSFNLIKTQLKSDQSVDQGVKFVRSVPPQLSAENLATFIGERDLCWLIEDFHKVESTEKVKLAQMMKVFMDCAIEYPSVKIIATGAVETARQVIECDEEMKNRVSEIEVNLMTEGEILSIIQKGEELLKIEIPAIYKNAIVKYSSGLGAVCHQMCLNICNATGITKTCDTKVTINSDDFEKSVALYIEECSDSVKSNFEKARKLTTKSSINHGDIILDALCSLDENGVDRFTLLRQIKRETPSYTDTILKRQLKSLTTQTRGSLIRFSDNSGLYSFSSPIYRAYALTIFHKNGRDKNKNQITSEISIAEIIRALEMQLRSGIGNNPIKSIRITTN